MNKSDIPHPLNQSSNILIDPIYNWVKQVCGEYTVWFIGNKKAFQKLTGILSSELELDADLIENISGLQGYYGVIAEGPNCIVAIADRIRSYPIFYIDNNNSFYVSNSAAFLKDNLDACSLNDLSFLEFRMAGYVTGRNTLYNGLFQLQGGEFLFFDKKSNKSDHRRYFTFYSGEIRKEKEEELIIELDSITNNVFNRVIDRIDGKAVWVPLSGGLDSRLVLCKLKELGCKNLSAFSYGASGNHEARVARKIAEKIGVPWRFIPISMKEAKSFFSSKKRRDYWDFAHGYSIIPNMQDIHALLKLMNKGKIHPNTVIMNGQTGDFITGGHIPHSFLTKEGDKNMLYEYIIEKHYSLWPHLKCRKNIEQIISKIKEQLGIDEQGNTGIQKLVSLYELWEWQERQCKYVVNGQRIYDFLQLEWELPLWDEDYLLFWRKIPYDLKYGRKLFKDYLAHFDFYSCFRDAEYQVWRWPGISIAVVPVARMVKFIFGEKYSNAFYNYARYFGHYRQFYAPYEFKEFFKKAQKIRGAISLNVETWLDENVMN